MSTALPWMARGGATRLPGLDYPIGDASPLRWRTAAFERPHGLGVKQKRARLVGCLFLMLPSRHMRGETFGYTGCDGVARPEV